MAGYNRENPGVLKVLSNTFFMVQWFEYDDKKFILKFLSKILMALISSGSQATNFN